MIMRYAFFIVIYMGSARLFVFENERRTGCFIEEFNVTAAIAIGSTTSNAFDAY